MSKDVSQNEMAIMPFQKYSEAVSVCNSLALLASNCTMVVFFQRITVLKNIETCWLKGQTAEVVYADGSNQEIGNETVTRVLGSRSKTSVDVKVEPEFAEQLSCAVDEHGDSSDDTIVDELLMGGVESIDEEDSMKVEALVEEDLPEVKTTKRRTSARTRRKPAEKKQQTSNRKARKKSQKKEPKEEEEGQQQANHDDHQVAEDPDTSYKFLCLHCQEVFETFAELKGHKTEAHGDATDADDSDSEESNASKSRDESNHRMHRCSLCERSFSCQPLLNLHVMNHYGMRMYRSRVFNPKFPPRKVEGVGVRKRHRDKAFRCRRCRMCFTLLPNLYFHVLFYHSSKTESISELRKKRGKVTRKRAKKSRLSFSRTVWLSESTAERRNSHLEDVCVTTSKERGSVVSNGSERLGISYLGSDSISCQNSAKKDRALEKARASASDLSVSSNARPFSCEVCGASFRQKSILTNHRRRHTGEKPLECDECEMRFTQHSMLRYHKRTRHTDEKPSFCSYCGKEFAKSILLEYHMRKHTGGRPYSCSLCKETFTSTRKHDEHVRTVHDLTTDKNEDVKETVEAKTKKNLRPRTQRFTSTTEEDQRKHECTFCKQQFQYESELKSHLLKHTGERPFQCEVCSKRFRRKSRYDGHVRNHTGEKPYACKACGMRFPQSGNLYYHVKTRHREKDSCADKPQDSHLKDSSFCQTPLKSEDVSVGCSEHKVNVTAERCELAEASPDNSHKGRGENERTSDAVHDGDNSHSCADCDKNFKNEAELESHKSSHSDERPFVCEFCSATFRQKSILVIHRRRHTGEKPLECDECKMRFLQHSTLRYHKRTRHTKELPCVCTYCGKEFAQSILLEYHVRKHTGGRPFICSYCGETFASLAKFEEHRKQHPVDTTNPAEPTFAMDNFRKIADEKVSTDSKSQPSGQSDDRPFACEFCDATFRQKSILVNHRRRHTGEKPYECEECKMRFKQHSALRYHRKTRHTVEQPSVCKYCNKEFPKMILLEYHLRKHTGGRPFACDQCSEMFASLTKFEEHKRQMHAESSDSKGLNKLSNEQKFVSDVGGSDPSKYVRKHACSTCGRSFQSKADLRRHTAVHTSEKPFMCTHCGMCFRLKASLEAHTRRHTGEKPYNCNDCGMQFRQQSTLKYHIRAQHTLEKPFLCLECGKMFRSSTMLKYHTRTHTGEKPFTCDVCESRFARPGQLKQHKKLHSITMSYTCDECGKKFRLQTTLAKHRKIHLANKPNS